MKTSTFKFLTLSAFCLGLTGWANAQVTFTNGNSVLHSDAGVLGSNGNNHGGNSLCIVDVNNDGLDDLVKLDENRYLRIEYQQGTGTFTYQYIGDCGFSSLWGMSMADVDHNGYKDLLYGNSSQAYIFKLNNTGTGFMGGAIALPNGAVFCQNMNFMDVNNDGWEDVFSTNDVDECRIWVNSGTGTFPAEQANSIINFNLTPGTGPGPALSGGAPNDQYDESGNYSSVWTDFDNDGDVDFYIAHCRQGSSTGDVRRLDRLWVNNAGVYTEAGATYNLNSGEEDWTSSFGDIDNDGDFDQFLTRVNVASTLFTNDGTGHMTSIGTLATGFNQPYQSIFEDFDNDGFVDILMAGVSQQEFYRNNGNGTFTQISNANLGFTNSTMLSFTTGDLNHDGQVDVYASYGSGYITPSGSTDDVFWKNTTNNSNHFITFVLKGTASTAGALGAKVKIYGPWGVQVREVRAGESYGTMATSALHFGLGSATSVDSVVVDWPATGSPSTVILNPTVDQFVHVTEGNCVSPTNVVTYTGSPVICSPGTLQLNASTGAGYTYLWSTGATTQFINVSTPGDYSVRVTAPGNACASWAAPVTVVIDPVETPTISALGDTVICPGASVDLMSSEASGNTWSTSETTQTISVSTPGTYSLNFQGACQVWPSNSITISNLNAPSPATTDDIIPVPGTGTLTATGVTTNIDWYDAASGGSLLYTGSPFVTPFVSTNTTYYAEETFMFGGSTGNNVGSTNIAAAANNGNTINGFLKFDVLTNCTLVSVQCSTGTAGNRFVELRNNVGTVIYNDTINFTTGTQTITLNYALTPGTDYQLGTNSAFNTAAFGFVNPLLVRDNTAGVSFPYTLPSVIDITTGNNGTSDVNAYYYFFNWVVDVDPTNTCQSVRSPATVYITAGVENQSDLNLKVYPNPAADFVNVEFTTPDNGEGMLSVFDMVGKKLYDLNLGMINGKVIRSINTSTYAPGIYIIKLTVNGKDYNNRLVIK
jgi:hypothetical protein